MSAVVVSPFVPILNLAGLGLNAGHLYVGVLGEDPVTNPQAVYWDAGLTIPATQPLDVLGGYLMYLGSPATAYTSAAGSLAVFDKDGVQVWRGSMLDNGQITHVDVAFSFLGGSPALAGETMGMNTLTSDVDFAANFAGSSGFFRVAATANYTATLQDQDGAALGTMSVAAAQHTPTFTTASGLPLVLAAGTTIIVTGSGTPDATLADGAWTLPGTGHAS